ncbi:Outer membrane porin protein [Burkholderia multivorans]|nr:Outer membrane porin protein [Burkholderia multivorans]
MQTARTAAGLVGGRHIAMIEGGSAGLQGSRWGLKGSEDLGGGLKALFVLESGFYSNNGVLNPHRSRETCVAKSTARNDLSACWKVAMAVRFGQRQRTARH